jgi:hypothetical protein
MNNNRIKPGNQEFQGLGDRQGTLSVSVQRSAFSHQLNERIQEDMIGDKIDHFASDSLSFSFLLKADC